jgi:peroxiredoxin
MRSRRLWGALVVTLVMGVVGVQFLGAAADTAAVTRGNACRALTPDAVPLALQNRDAPDFELPDASGKRWSLRSLRGRPVLLNFWATWCPPCVDEVPSIEDLATALGDDAVVLAVSLDEDWAALKRFFPRGTPLPVLLDQSKEVPKKYGTEKYPETYLIDAKGQVRHYFVNTRKWNSPEAAQCLESLR